MFVKNLYLAIALSISTLSPLMAINKVEIKALLEIGNKKKEFVAIIDSETHTQISMENESLGYALKLVNAEEGNERIETTPTHNRVPIANFFRTGKKMTIGAGCNLNGQVIEKDLIITFLSIKKIS